MKCAVKECNEPTYKKSSYCRKHRAIAAKKKFEIFARKEAK